ncbi:MAG: hypothetical protein V4604_00850 [Bacteroidota bacterium]
MKGHALLIGVSETSVTNYGKNYDLSCAEPDVAGMNGLLNGIPEFKGNITTLTKEKATWNNTIDWLKNTKNQVKTENAFFHIYFTGHGCSVKETANSTQGAFCFYDKIILENQIKQQLENISSNIKVYVISDSCHSGELVDFEIYNKLTDLESKFKELDSSIWDYVSNLEDNKVEYCEALKSYNSSNYTFKPKTEICILTACGKKQKTEYNSGCISAFTNLVLNNWSVYMPSSYFTFHQEIFKQRPKYRKPEIKLFGSNSGFFQNTVPFILNFNSSCIDDITERHLTLKTVAPLYYELNNLPTTNVYSHVDHDSFIRDEIPQKYESIMDDLLGSICSYSDINVFTIIEVRNSQVSNGFPIPLLELIPSAMSDAQLGLVVVYDVDSETVVHKGRTKGKVSNEIGG